MQCGGDRRMILALPPKFAFRRPQPRASALAATVCSLLVVLVLRGASSAALSPDGKFLYVASYAASGLAIFSRDDAGRLTQVGCVRSVSTCTPGPSLSGAIALAISPDGTSLYVAAYDADAIVS